MSRLNSKWPPLEQSKDQETTVNSLLNRLGETPLRAATAVAKRLQKQSLYLVIPCCLLLNLIFQSETIQRGKYIGTRGKNISQISYTFDWITLEIHKLIYIKQLLQYSNQGHFFQNLTLFFYSNQCSLYLFLNLQNSTQANPCLFIFGWHSTTTPMIPIKESSCCKGGGGQKL